MMFKSVELLSNKPKGKDTLWNLSQLLGDRVVATPEKTIGNRMFHDNKNYRRLIMTPDLCAKNQTLPRPSTKSVTRINFQHYRIKSSLKFKGDAANTKDVFLAGQDALMLRRHNSQSSIKNSLKKGANPLKIQQKETGSVISFDRPFKSQQFLAGNTIIKKRVMPPQLNTRFSSDPQSDDFLHHWGKSLQINKRTPPPTLRQSFLSNQTSPKSRTVKKSFLRKGSSLQKQIVVNLLKNKLIKEHEFDIEKEYTINDIVKMVKLYKGVHNEAVRNPEMLFSDNARQTRSPQKTSRMGKSCSSNPVCPISVVQKFQRSIQGWQIQQELIADHQIMKKDHDEQDNHIFIANQSQTYLNPGTQA